MLIAVFVAGRCQIVQNYQEGVDTDVRVSFRDDQFSTGGSKIGGLVGGVITLFLGLIKVAEAFGLLIIIVRLRQMLCATALIWLDV